MFAKPKEHTPMEKIGFSGSFYFKINDVDSLWNELSGKTKVLLPD